MQDEYKMQAAPSWKKKYLQPVFWSQNSLHVDVFWFGEYSIRNLSLHVNFWFCRSVVFQLDRAVRREPRIFQEMSSFPETKAELLMIPSSEAGQTFLWYHQAQLSRIYPKAQRMDSSNYNPMPMWNIGSQMAALNFQTGDKPMQLNQAKFALNGGCGLVRRQHLTI